MKSFRSLALSFACVVLAGIAGCTEGGRTVPPGGDGGPGSDGSTTPGAGLRIEPADHVETISEGTPVAVDYRAFLRAADGSERDVTAEVTWSSTVEALGTFTGARFISASDRGGRTNIRASMATLEGTTSLTLRLERTIITPGTPADAPTRFGGTPDASRAPEIVYPEDATMVPPNLGELEIHYRTAGSTLFELHVSSPAVELRIYFGCPEAVGGGCIYTPDRDVWESIATAARGQGAITYRMRGVDDGGRLGETAERTITVAEEDITGGLYYWNAGGGTIDRFEFGVRGARAETFLDRTRTGAMMCVGCHVLSRDGTRIAVGTDIPTTTFQVFDVASRARIFSRGAAGGFGGFPQEPNFSSFSPDATQIVTSSLAGLRILDGTTGSVVLEGLGGGPSSMPDWSPDGQRIVYARHDAPATFGLADAPGITDGRITRLDWNGASWVVGPTLVAGGGNNYYPAFSPDGEWVVFNRSPANTNSMGGEGGTGVRDAELWVVSSSGTGVAMRLGNIGGLADSWPKWDPTAYRDGGRDLFWFAWSSRRAFGLRLAEDTRMQLWMSAFDPAQAAMGREAAYPAFRLPFQDIATGNHIAQWVTSVERLTCDDDADCGGEFCVDGRCYEQPPLI
ncbi:MAG: hypothetical protein M3Y87_14530 [Myxococcota bacterium]|nr:hypothetical protein [Myxococcota bacterium]